MQMSAMDPNDFAVFKERSIANLTIQFAEDFVENLECSVLRAQQKFNAHLPLGLQTPGHYFYLLKNDQLVSNGYLWFGEREEHLRKKIFIYDILVEENFRGKGLGKWMLNWLEIETKKKDLQEITLHVLGYNHVARELYESMGFEATNIYMSKKV